MSKKTKKSSGIGGVWREEVLARAGRLDQDLAALNGSYASGLPADFATREMSHRTDAVRRMARAPSTLSDRWSGVLVEDCWRELRLAEEAMIHLKPNTDVASAANDALNHAQYYLTGTNKSVAYLTEELRKSQNGDTSKRELRSSILPVLSAAHDASDRMHRELRSFRNQLLVLSMVLIFMALVASLSAFLLEPDKLLPAPKDVTQGWAVAVTIASGAIGALFSAIPSLAQIPEKAMPFNPIREQALLKVAVGAWSGLVGLLVVTAGIEPASTNTTTSFAGLVVVAALFGASQEAITRFADHKASDLRAAPE